MKKEHFIAACTLGVMFILMLFSAKGDSAIMDELAHIPAGYSYIMEKDMRLNPEHPPLMKDLAGIPLAFLRLHFPTDAKAWQDEINGQWTMGSLFLYHSGNNPDQILFWARLPMMLLAIVFGCLLYLWTEKRYGSKTALLTLFLFAFSPTFIAHSRYVTTDLAAAFAFFIGLATFIDFIEAPTRKNIIKAGIAFGIAQLLKFSLFLLAPIYGAIAILWMLIMHHDHFAQMTYGERIAHRIRYGAILIGKIILIGLIGTGIIWTVYIYHIWNYPMTRQLHDATEILNSFGRRWMVDLDIWLIMHAITRPLGQYVLGLLMVIQRAAGGNTTYFLGETSNHGWWYYFPIAYLLKETFALHLLTLTAIAASCKAWMRSRRFAPVAWMREHIAETTMLFFIVFYWGYSMHSPLNIGVRHVLPTFPFIYLLVSRSLIRWAYAAPNPDPQTTAVWMSDIYEMHIRSIPKQLIIALLLFWIGFGAIVTYPHYLSYYNELAGGSREGYRYIVDSNYDWGQDLKRLQAFVVENHIDHIALEYFGGGSPDYYLGSRFEPWWSAKGAPHGYFAISATLREGAFGTAHPDVDRKPENSYEWLRPYEPIARAGESIFIYKLP